MYKDGQEVMTHGIGKYFLPNGKITDSAFGTHGFDKETLKQNGTKSLTYEDCKDLVSFLHKEGTFPIIAHKVKYDRDQVLKPAFKRLRNCTGLPRDSRWICTMDLADQRPDLVPRRVSRGLDSLLKHFELE